MLNFCRKLYILDLDSFLMKHFLLLIFLCLNPCWPGGGRSAPLGFFCRNFFLQKLFFCKTNPDNYYFLCNANNGKLWKKWFSTIFRNFFNGRADLPPPKPWRNCGRPGLLGLNWLIWKHLSLDLESFLFLHYSFRVLVLKNYLMHCIAFLGGL